MKRFLFTLFILTSFSGLAQFDASARENELAALLDALRNAKTDSAKTIANANFDRLMEQTLSEPTVFDLNFTKLNSVGIIDSPDGLVRIVNWNVELADQVQKYNGYVITRTSVSKEARVIKLNYAPDIYNPKPTEVVDGENWYGALYYQIIPFNNGSKDSYILLGWNGAGMNSNMKLIDVMSFSAKGVKFGQSIFKTKDATLKRVFFEHSSQCVMSLKYEPEYNRIIFDHLSPESPSMVGFYEYYVPDMSYDAYVFGGNKLVLKEDVIGINKKDPTVIMATKIDPKTDEVVLEEVDNKWINPSAENPSEQNVHIAALPEGVTAEDIEKAEKKENASKSNGEKETALDVWNRKKHHREDKNSNSVIGEGKKKKH